MHLQENTFDSDLDLGSRTHIKYAKNTVYIILPVHLQFEVATSNGLGGDAFKRKYIVSPLTLTLGQGHTHKMLPSTLYIILPMHLQSLKLLCPTV